jgi:hypothetical protein
MNNQLKIEKEYWPDVTNEPHFIVNLTYEGCTLTFDDIYFDKCDDLLHRLEQLEHDRKGKLKIDGGFRFSASVEILSRGDIKLTFNTESEASFPGKLRLEGYFHGSGEYTSKILTSLINLFKNGSEFII